MPWNPGLSREESRNLIRELSSLLWKAGFIHSWSPGDTLIWDNRALLHRARLYDYSKARVLTATVAGTRYELAYYPNDPEAREGREALAKELEELYEVMTAEVRLRHLSDLD